MHLPEVRPTHAADARPAASRRSRGRAGPCDPPPPPAPGEVQLRVRAVGLNHIDVWGFRGMAFAKRQYPLVVGAEAAGEVVAIGEGVDRPRRRATAVVPYAALVCGTCKPCRTGRENLCENPSGVRGFHIDGFAQELTNHPARLTVKIPPGVSLHDAASFRSPTPPWSTCCSTMPGWSPANGSWCMPAAPGIGSIAIRIAKSIGCTVITTVGSADKAAKAKALGADHVINYREDRFEGVVRKLTARKGVDVVFEHTGADTWAGSLFSLKRGGRLVTCGATSGPSGSINLMQLFQQQYRIIGSFGSPLSALRARAGPHRRRACGR